MMYDTKPLPVTRGATDDVGPLCASGKRDNGSPQTTQQNRLQEGGDPVMLRGWLTGSRFMASPVASFPMGVANVPHRMVKSPPNKRKSIPLSTPPAMANESLWVGVVVH